MKKFFTLVLFSLFLIENNYAAINWVGNMTPSGGSLTTGSTTTISLQIFKSGVTEPAGQGSGIIVQLYYAQVSSWGGTWTNIGQAAMTYSSDIGNNDVYSISFVHPYPMVEFTARASDDGGTTWKWQESGNARLLPIVLADFTAKSVKRENHLSWTTETESNASHFEVEKSTNGTAWSKMKEVKAFGNSVRRQDYNFTDETPNKGINYYRLKMVDRDGSFEYSKVVSANFNGGGKVNIFPNPAQDVLSITVSNDVKEATVEIFNTNGQAQMRNVLNGNQLNISELAAGLYFIQISDENGQVISREKLIKK